MALITPESVEVVAKGFLTFEVGVAPGFGGAIKGWYFFKGYKH
jgi:hypothetical protein